MKSGAGLFSTPAVAAACCCRGVMTLKNVEVVKREIKAQGRAIVKDNCFVSREIALFRLKGNHNMELSSTLRDVAMRRFMETRIKLN